MGGAETKKRRKNERKAGDFAERKKKKKKRRRKNPAIAKIFEGPQQVASSLNVALNCTDSASAKLKKKRRLMGLQKCELPSDEVSSEKEKQSLLSWVEMCIEPNHTDIEIGRFVKGSSVDGSTDGHTHSLTACARGRICNWVTFAENAACDHLPNAHAFKADHKGHVCGKKSLSDGQSNHHTERCASKVLNGQSFHEGLTNAVAINDNKCLLSKHINRSIQEQSVPIEQSSRVPNGEISVASPIYTHDHDGSSVDASRSVEIECCCPAGANSAYQRGLSGGHARSGEDNSSCQAGISNYGSLPKENDSVSLSNSANPHNNKRKREDDKVLNYVLKRSIVLHPSPFMPLANESRTTKTVVIAWGREIPVTLTSEACTIQEWISSQSGNLFGLDVEWRPNRSKGENNKVALLQLCNESECLIIQMLFLDKKPQELCKFLSDPSKSLAGVGVLADGKRLLHDYGLECQGGIELTTLAVERLKRDELRNVGLKVLVQEVLGLKLDKPKKVTLSNWAKVKLDPAQINYACMDAWASFALSHKLLVDL